MSVIHKFATVLTESNDEAISYAGGQTLSSSYSTEVGTVGQTIDEQLGTGVTNSLVVASWTAAGVQSIVLVADADVTLETNSGSSPANTIALKANRPFVWRRGDGYYAYPFAGDVSALYFTTSSAVRIKGRILS